MEGWITLHRKFLTWEWFDKPEMVQLFIWLLLNANYADKKWQGQVIKRGQILTTTPKIMEALRLTERQTRTCISRLKSTGEVSVKTTNRFTIITICNYDRYQNDNLANDGQNDRQNVTQATDNRRTSDGLYNDILNVSKQINNNNNNNISVCVNSAHTREDKERDLIFQIFFFKNFINPAAEVERFYNHYEAQGWERGNGQKIRNRIAAAKAWEQEDKTKKRFPDPFVQAICEVCEGLNPEEATSVMRSIVRIEIDAEIVSLILNKDVHKIIEKNAAPLKAYFGRNFQYKIIRKNKAV